MAGVAVHTADDRPKNDQAHSFFASLSNPDSQVAAVAVLS